jgi:hypothetical protein
MKQEDIQVGESYYIRFHSKTRDFVGVAKCVDKVEAITYPVQREAHFAFEDPTGKGVGFLVKADNIFNSRIELGETYYIEYKDTNYPCDCECHEPGSTILHITACCRDRSYKGLARCMRMYNIEDKDGNGIFMYVMQCIDNPSRFFNLTESSIFPKEKEKS